MPRVLERLGEYELLEKLGQGGMAEVWKARASGPAGFSRLLVIKRILPHLAEDPTFVKLFVSEARISARLMHANIVQVFGFGEERGEYYLAMEYVEGHDLITTLRRVIPKGPPPPGLAAFAVRELCRALAYAHALTDEDGRPLQIIHRDVSPSNVMLGLSGGVKLLDFGVAKAMAADKTNTRSLRGKFGYMAPEQVAGEDFDHRADLFAAGVVLHETLVGRRLFLGADHLATVAQVRAARVERPSRMNPSVPPALDAICLKALARDREARYQSGAEMAMALDEIVHQLRWGPERLAEFLRAAFDDAGVVAAATEPEAQPPTVISGDKTTAPRRRRFVLAGAAAATLALGAAGWMAKRHLGAEARATEAAKTPQNTAGASANTAGASPNTATASPNTATASLNTPNGSLNRANGSLDRANGSLDRANGSPGEPAALSNRANGSPDRGNGSPDRANGSLDSTSTSANRANGSPSEAAAAPGERAAAPPAMVAVSVVSVPPGAEVFVGEERRARGRTPLLFSLASGDDKTRLKLIAPRYEPLVTEISSANDTQLRVAMVPLRRAPAAPPPPSRRAPSKPPVTTAKGDLADPFSKH